jgi:hypothetical protein
MRRGCKRLDTSTQGEYTKSKAAYENLKDFNVSKRQSQILPLRPAFSYSWGSERLVSRNQVLELRNVDSRLHVARNERPERMGPPYQPGSGDVEVIEIELSDDEMTRLPEPKTRLLGDE